MITQAVKAPEYGGMGGEYGMYQGGFPGAAMGMQPGAASELQGPGKPEFISVDKSIVFVLKPNELEKKKRKFKQVQFDVTILASTGTGTTALARTTTTPLIDICAQLSRIHTVQQSLEGAGKLQVVTVFDGTLTGFTARDGTSNCLRTTELLENNQMVYATYTTGTAVVVLSVWTKRRAAEHACCSVYCTWGWQLSSALAQDGCSAEANAVLLLSVLPRHCRSMPSQFAVQSLALLAQYRQWTVRYCPLLLSIEDFQCATQGLCSCSSALRALRSVDGIAVCELP
eukprot:12600-Heterococcus_DN1.PRE.1